MRRAPLAGLVVAAAGAAGVILAAAHDPGRALLAWTAAYGAAVSTAVGALALVMVFHVTGARWPVLLAPRIMAIVRTLPLFALLFVPIALGLHQIYPWAHDMPRLEGPVRAALEHQRAWNNPTFFLARAVAYLVTWSALAELLRRAHEAHLRAPSAATLVRQRRLSAAGLPIIALTLTFASFDWFMSLEPGWVSSIYGLYFFCGGLMSAVSLVAILAWAARRSEPDEEATPGPAHVHAIGRLMLMSVILWAYVAFFQLMLIWIGDLPREVTFFVARSRGSFVAISAVLLLGHFVAPFVALLSRPLKRRAALLALVGAWLVVMNAVDVAWLVLPAGGEHVGILDAAPFVLVTGIAFAYGAFRLGAFRRAHGALGAADQGGANRDPALADSLRYRSP